LKLKYDEVLTKIAFNVNLRHYSVDAGAGALGKVVGELQLAALREAVKVEALAPYATEDNARTAVLLMLGLPTAWVLCAALGALGLWPFAKKMRPVPKSVAKESVSLRTPTPEKKSKPRTPLTSGGRTPGSGGKEFTSPEGEKVRFA